MAQGDERKLYGFYTLFQLVYTLAKLRNKSKEDVSIIQIILSKYFMILYSLTLYPYIILYLVPFPLGTPQGLTLRETENGTPHQKETVQYGC